MAQLALVGPSKHQEEPGSRAAKRLLIDAHEDQDRPTSRSLMTIPR